MNVVGLGTAACNIANCFNTYPQYNIVSVNTENNNYNNYVKVNKQETHEEYENNFLKPDLHLDKNEPVLFVICGASAISGCCLRMLEGIKNKQITILYIKPDIDILSGYIKKRQRLTFQVLQQYTRSSLFERMYIVDNTMIEKLVPDVSIKNYWSSINQLIADTFHMINVFKNTDPIMSSASSIKIPKPAKISTISIVNPDFQEEKYFYDLQHKRSSVYFIGANNEKIETDNSFLKDIRGFVKNRAEDNLDVVFSVVQTKYQQNYVYGLHHASFIQEENNN